MATENEFTAVTQADIDAWERFGPAIFHCDMTGPKALAAYRIAAEQHGRNSVLSALRNTAGRSSENATEMVLRKMLLDIADVIESADESEVVV